MLFYLRKEHDIMQNICKKLSHMEIDEVKKCQYLYIEKINQRR